MITTTAPVPPTPMQRLQATVRMWERKAAADPKGRIARTLHKAQGLLEEAQGEPDELILLYHEYLTTLYLQKHPRVKPIKES